MLIPTGIDAPLYHRPYGTIGLIIANTLLFFMVDINLNNYEWWVLTYGSFSPVQWLTSLFAHANFFHLLGNMLFLTVFGLIVEGKVGNLFFLIIYLAIGLTANSVEQLIMFGADGGSLGASGAISGLMMVCMFWAPLNKIRFTFIFIYYPITFHWTVWFAALFYVAWDFYEALFAGFAMSTSVLHLMGAASGIFPGWYFLKHGLVDCEGWDLLTILDRRRRGLGTAPIELNRAYREKYSDHETKPNSATTATFAHNP